MPAGKKFDETIMIGSHSAGNASHVLHATHPTTTSQADDKRSGQLFGCANHYEQER